MSLFVKKNNARGAVNDNPLSAGATTLNLQSGQGANFPSTFPFLITLWDADTYPSPSDDPNTEIVRVTARSTDALTIVRAQEGTSDVEHDQGTRVEMLLTAGIFNDPTYGIDGNLPVGGNAFGYAFSTTTTDSDPGSGNLRYDNATPSSVSQIFIDDEDKNGSDIQAWLRTFDDSDSTIKGYIKIFKRDDASKFAIYQVDSLTEATGYFKINVTPVDDNDTFSDEDDVVVAFVRTGDKGDTGATGPTGNTGATGPAGSDGDDGTSAGILYNFDDGTADSDPGSGNLRFNNATISSVTKLFIDDNEAGGADVSSFIDQWDDSTDPNVTGIVYIVKVSDKTTFAIFNVTGAVTDETGYRSVVVTHVVSNGSFSDTDNISVLFSRTGNKGTDGAGSGDVSGPASSTDNAIARFDGTGGKTLQNSSVIIDDSNNITGVNQLDIDSANGVDVNPGSDTDADILTVGVTGAPKLQWDESNDAFRFTKGIDINDNDGLTLGTGRDAEIKWDGTDLLIDYDSPGAGTTDLRIQEGGVDKFVIEAGGAITTGDWQATDIAIAHGGTGASSASAARTNLGLAIGSDVQAHGDVLDDLNTLGAASSDGEIIVATGAGAFAYESGATARTSLGLGTGDSPQFTAIELGNASDTTIARSGAGVITVEGVEVTLNTATQTLTNKTLTTPVIATVHDSNGNEALELSATASAVNHLKAVNSATGNAPELQAVGDDTNIDLKLTPKGTGDIDAGTNTIKNVVDPTSDQEAATKKYVDDNAGGGGTLIAQSTTQNDIKSTTTETNMVSETISGGTLGADGALHLRILFSDVETLSGSLKFRVKYGATTLIVTSNLFFNLGQNGYLDVYLMGAGTTGSQKAIATLFVHTLDTSSTNSSDSMLRVENGTSSEDSTANKTFAVTVQPSDSDASSGVTVEGWVLRKVVA